MISSLRPRNDTFPGLILLACAALSLIVANSGAANIYFTVLHTNVLGLDILHWINDALMSLFFLLVGLEIKRELIGGHLATWRARVLPGAAALGGMIGPAVIFIAFNSGDADALRGWAVPIATDIAFALGVLSLLGARVPLSLKIFLTALAILDDLGAVAVIAVFYTDGLSWLMLLAASAILGSLVFLNRRGVTTIWVYIALGAALWFVVFRSGLHPTLAGVALAMTIPLRPRSSSPLEKLEQGLKPLVALIIVPLFGFANAGVSLGPSVRITDVSLGVALGLLFGKQVGVFGTAVLVIRTRLASFPERATWIQLYGVSILCGIGFTMSLFISLLAYTDLVDAAKIGILAGSLLSAFFGLAVLFLVSKMAVSKTGVASRKT